MWYQIKVMFCPKKQVDGLTEAFENMNALSVSIDDAEDEPIFEPLPGETPIWSSCHVTALFDDEHIAQQARDKIQKAYAKLETLLETLPDQDWERTWMDNFHPQAFGDRLWICPSWLEPPNPDATNIILDPGLAFGTGTHPTTSLCLKWLNDNDVSKLTVMDYGCGSGILAIAALKLGATSCYAIDIDPQAIIATKDNANRNAIDSNILMPHTPESLASLQEQPKVDLLMANILLGPLSSLGNTFKRYLKPQGRLIVSGLLREQAEPLIEAYQSIFSLHAVTYEEDWARLEFDLM